MKKLIRIALLSVIAGATSIALAETTIIDHSDGTKTRVKSDKDGHQVDHVNKKSERTGGESVGGGHSHKEVVDQHIGHDSEVREKNPLFGN